MNGSLVVINNPNVTFSGNDPANINNASNTHQISSSTNSPLQAGPQGAKSMVSKVLESAGFVKHKLAAAIGADNLPSGREFMAKLAGVVIVAAVLAANVSLYGGALGATGAFFGNPVGPALAFTAVACICASGPIVNALRGPVSNPSNEG